MSYANYTSSGREGGRGGGSGGRAGRGKCPIPDNFPPLLPKDEFAALSLEEKFRLRQQRREIRKRKASQTIQKSNDNKDASADAYPTTPSKKIQLNLAQK